MPSSDVSSDISSRRLSHVLCMCKCGCRVACSMAAYPLHQTPHDHMDPWGAIRLLDHLARHTSFSAYPHITRRSTTSTEHQVQASVFNRTRHVLRIVCDFDVLFWTSLCFSLSPPEELHVDARPQIEPKCAHKHRQAEEADPGAKQRGIKLHNAA